MVPNPLFDLAGIMCGQFGIPFWKFFATTVVGKAIVKTHIQTAFIISVCNNQLFELMENEFIWMLSFIPGITSILPNYINVIGEPIDHRGEIKTDHFLPFHRKL